MRELKESEAIIQNKPNLHYYRYAKQFNKKFAFILSAPREFLTKLQDFEFTFREGMSQSTCFHSFGFRALFGQLCYSRKIASRALALEKRLARFFLHSITWLT